MPVLEVVPREGSEAGQGRDWIAGVVLDYEQRARTALHVDGGIDEGEALQPLVVRDESLEGLRLRLDQDAMPPAVDDVLVQPVKGNTVERSDLNEEERMSRLAARQVMGEHILEVDVQRVVGPGRQGRHTTEAVAMTLELRLDEALHRAFAFE
jgi:hypothetical protein